MDSIENKCINCKIVKEVLKLFNESGLFTKISFDQKSYQEDKVLHIGYWLKDIPNMKIDGIATRSEFWNSYAFSSECSDGKYVNGFEVQLPDLLGEKGEPSIVQIYLKALGDNDLTPAGVHIHWSGSEIYSNDHGVWGLHHQNVGMCPVKFAQRTINALHVALEVVKERVLLKNKFS